MAMMISKFHKIIQSKVVWTVFAILISVAFVGVYTGSKSGDPQPQRTSVAGSLFGEDISQQEFGTAYRNVYVIYSISTGRPITVTDEIHEIISEAAWIRIATLKKAEQLGLTVTKEQIIASIQSQQIFRNQQTGQFDKNIYDQFVSGFLPRTRMAPKDFEQLIAENVLIEKASSTAAQGALVTEEEIKDAFHLYSDLLTVNYATLPRSLAAEPTTTEAEAKAYFEQNKEQFRMPEKRIVNYVQFAVTDHLGKREITEEMISGYYEKNKQRFVKDATAETPEYLPLEEVKDAIKESIADAMARKAAADEADAFAAQLADETTTFAAAAAASGLTIIDNTPAFTLSDTVKGVDPTAPFARAAFGLVKEAALYYSDPVVGRDFVYVIELHKTFDSFIPTSFDLVKDQAMELAKIEAVEKAYIEKANAIHEEFKTALAAGTPFADLAAKYNLNLQTTAPFNVTTRLEDEFARQIMGSTLKLEANEFAELVPTANEFLVAYVSAKEIADEAAGLPDLRENLTASISNEKASQMIAAWQQSLLKEAGFKDLRNSTGGES